jgi:hypothetical protein
MPRVKASLSIAEVESLLKDLRQRKSALLRRRAKMERQLGEIDRELRRIDGVGGRLLGRPKNAKSLAATVHDVLKDAGKPMRVSEIADAAIKAGYRSSSPSFRGIVNQLLIKDKQFVQTQRGFYSLRKAS